MVARQAPLPVGFSRQEQLEWVAMPFSKALPDPGIKPVSLNASCSGRRILYH